MMYLHDIDFFDLSLIKHLACGRVLHFAFTNICDFPAHLQQPLPPIYPSIRQDDWVTLDRALRVMGVRDVAGHLVQFGGTDGTN
jgi:hypothetical protein